MDRSLHGGEDHGFAVKDQDYKDEAATSTSEAVQSGTSTPDESSSSDETGEYSKTPPGCNCGRYQFTLDDDRTVSRRSTKVFCPVHGVNESFRDSFAEHAAWRSTRGSYRRCDCYHVTITLHADDVDGLGLSEDDTRAVLSQLLPRLRTRLKRADEDAEAILSLSPRPSDGEWHMHVLVLSKGCSTWDVMEVFSLAGTDLEVTTPRSREVLRDEAPMSAERFATATGAYLFDNRIHGTLQGADTKFSGWNGAGYWTTEAKGRRSPAGGDSAPAQCSSTQIPTEEANGNDESGDDSGEFGGNDGKSIRPDGDNAGVEPVEVANAPVQSEDERLRVVVQALMDRMHTPVLVDNLGRCKLTWVEVGDEGVITCRVRPLEAYGDEKRDVSWQRIESTDAPVAQSASNADESPTMTDSDAENDAEDGPTGDESADKDTGKWGAGKAEKYVANARHRRVSLVLPDGRRHVREYVDGEKVRDEKIAPRRA